jgi:hypothetical protein
MVKKKSRINHLETPTQVLSGFYLTACCQKIEVSGSSDTILQESGVNLVGAASSREYSSGTMLPSFIAAGSRSHKGR